MCRRELLAALGAAGAVGGAATGTARGQQASDWPSFQRDLANTGLDSSTTGPTAAFDGELLFESNDVVGSPVLADGTLYAATADGVVALDPSSGDVRWRAGPDPGRTYAPILVRDGLLYVAGDGDAHLRALDTATGDVQWMREIGRGAPAYEPTNDVVFLAGYALDATTGDDRWHAETSEQEYTPPAVGGGRLYVIDRDRNLVAIDASDGSTVWQRSGLHTASVTFVAESNGAYTPMVLVPIDYSKVVAYRADDGTELWRSPDLAGAGDITTPVAVTPSGGALAVVTYGDATAIYLQDGSVAWETEVSGWLNTPPAIVDDVAYSATNEELLVALDVTDGTVLESGVVGRPEPYAAPVVSDDRVFLADRNGLTRVDGGGGGGTVDLHLEMTADTAERGDTAAITYRVTNQGDADATGLKGFIDPPSDAWEILSSEDLTTAPAGGTDTATVELAVPSDAEGEYEFAGVVEDDAGNVARDTATVTVETGLRLTAQPARRTAAPGESMTFQLVLENPGDDPIPEPRVGVNTHYLVDYEPLDGLVAEELTAEEATWNGGGRRAILEWDSIPAGDAYTPTLTFGVKEDVETGEYDIQFDSYYGTDRFVDGPRTTATVAVERFDKLRAEKLDLAATIDEVTVRNVDDERRARALLSEISAAVADGDVTRERAEAAAERMVLLEEVDEFWLRGVSRAEYPRDIDSNLAEKTAVGVLKAATSILVTKWIAKKVAVRLELGEVGEYLLEIALKLVEKAVEILLDHMLDVVPATVAKARASTDARGLADDVLDGAYDGADDLADDIGAAVDAGAGVVGDALRSFFEPGVLADLQSMDVFAPNELVDGLEGPQPGAVNGRDEYVRRMHETLEAANELLETFEHEYETFATVQAAFDLYESVVVQGDGKEAFLDHLRFQIAIFRDLISILLELFGDVAVGGPAMMKSASERGRGVDSVIAGEVLE